VIYVYSCIVDGFDNLRSPACPIDFNVRYICFTNVPNLPRVYPWEYRPIYPVGAPCRSARVAKILPHLLLPEDAEYSIYHDGNFQLREDPNKIIDLVSREPWAAHKHPCRNCVYQEAEILLRENIGTRALVEAEIARYREQQYPEGAGLWANGLIVRRHTPEVAALNEQWWELYAAGSERDQLSFPVARHAMGLPIRTIDADVWSSPYMLFRWHGAWKDREDNPDYRPERERIRARLERLRHVTGSSGGVTYVDY